MSAYTAEQAHAAVARGAAWLDKKCPTWFREINLAKLDLSRGNVCVLGQTAACVAPRLASNRPCGATAYEVVLNRYRINPAGRWPEDHGFNAPELGEYREVTAAYEMLTIAWREYIWRRRLEQQP